MQSVSPSQARTLLERVDINDDTAIGQFVEEWGGRNVSLSAIYRHFLQGSGLNPGATFSPVSGRVIEEQENTIWRIIGNSITELKADDIQLASAFVLAFGEGSFQFKEQAGIRYIESTRHVRVTAEHLRSLNTFFDLPIDKVVYQSDCDKKTLPKGFVRYRLKPYLKEQWNKWENDDRSIAIQAQGQDESFDIDDTDDDDESIGQDHSSYILPEEQAELDSVHEIIERLTWLDEEIDRLFDQYGVNKNDDASLTPEKLMRVIYELHQLFLEENSLASVASELDAPVSGEENDRTVREAIIKLTSNFQEYLYEKSKSEKKSFYEKIRRFVDDIIQCWARNKRIIVFNAVDMLIGALVSILIVNLIIAGIIYIVSATTTLVTLRLIIFGWHSTREAIHKSKIQALQNNIEAIESTIEEQSERLEAMRKANVSYDDQAMVQAQRILDQSEKELHQHRCQLLGRKAYLAEKINITEALISERREFDRLTEEIELSKGQLDGSLDAEIGYAKKLAKLKQQEDRLGAAMEPVSKTISYAYEAYTYNKSKIEKDLRIILEANSPFFGEGVDQERVSDEDLWRIFSKAIQQKGEFEPQPTRKKIWRFLAGPKLIQQLVEEALHENDQDERAMLAKFCEEVQELTPENYIMIHARNLDDAVNQLKQDPKRSVRCWPIDCESDVRIKAKEFSGLGSLPLARMGGAQTTEAAATNVSPILLPGSSNDMDNNQEHDMHDFYIMEQRGNKDYTCNVNLLLSDWLDRVRNGIRIDQVVQTQSQRLDREHIIGGLKESWDTFVAFLSYYFRRALYRWHEAGFTTALVSGTTVSATSVLKATFPNPGAAGGLGIVLWFCFRHFGSWLDRKNDRINKGLTDARERLMVSYDAPSDVPDQTEASTSAGRKGQTPVTDNRTSEGTGYFNLGVLSDNEIAQLSEDEWRALRRQTKHTIQEITPLVEALNEVQIQLERLVEDSRQSRDVTVADREKVACLLLRYTLLTRRIESTIKVPEQANYELVRHVHRINKRVRHVYTPNQKPMIPAAV